MSILLLQGDITKQNVDAIVNAANTSLLGGGGVDGAIHKAGGKQILDECIAIRNKQGGCKTGEAVITTRGNLPAKFVIHTVGPVWNNGKSNEVQLLANCYINSLKIAKEKELKSIAFSNISTGIYKFPKQQAASIAISTVQQFLQENDFAITVYFVCFDMENYNYYQQIMH